MMRTIESVSVAAAMLTQSCCNLARLALPVCLCLLWLAACKSPPPGGEGSLAWTEINGHTEAEITAAVVQVFGARGYARNPRKEGLVFEKSGGFGANLAYGDFDKGVVNRVQVDLTTKVNGNYLLHCRAWNVREAGDRALEDPQRVTALYRKSYQELLDSVKGTLATTRPPRP